MQQLYEKWIPKIKQETNLSTRMYGIVANYLNNTIRRYQLHCSAEKSAGISVKREIKSEGTRGGISTGPKWSRLAEAAEKQSRYTTYNNGTNICW